MTEFFTCLLRYGSLPAESNHQFICAGNSDGVCYQEASEEEEQSPDIMGIPLFIITVPRTACFFFITPLPVLDR